MCVKERTSDETGNDGETDDMETAKKSEKRQRHSSTNGQSDASYTHINSKIANVGVLLIRNIWISVETQWCFANLEWSITTTGKYCDHTAKTDFAFSLFIPTSSHI